MDSAPVRERIGQLVEARRGRRRPGKPGELWIDHRCLFHDDDHSSASYEVSSGVYFCRSEVVTYDLPAVVKALGLDPAAFDKLPAPKDRVYTYRWPDGTISHLKHRSGDGKPKRIWQTGPDGISKPPAQRAPIYGELSSGCVALVVEGENCVDAVLKADDHFQGIPIRAITAGSTADLTSHADAIAAYLVQIAPSRIVLWADHDQPGNKAMANLAAACHRAKLEVCRYAFTEGGPTADVVDYLVQNNSLSELVASLFADQGNTAQVIEGAIKIEVTDEREMVFPHTRRLVKIGSESAGAAWLELYGSTPDYKAQREFHLRLLQKSATNPSRVAYRRVSGPSSFWWRPEPTGPCFMVSAKGVELAPDPPGVVLLTPGEQAWAPSRVNLHSQTDALVELGALFGLDATELAMCEGWMVAGMLGLQTPIMLVKGQAGTGKSTLARILTSVLEPIVPHLTLGRHNQGADERELVRTLQRSPALVLDNVSGMSGETEDLLSQLVTGLTRAIRTLYEDQVSMLRMYRAICITTIAWDPYKGDLADRIVVCEPKLQEGLWKSDRGMTQLAEDLVPRLRGQVLTQCVRFYQGIDSLNGTSPWRIGDLGYVFTTLGYDAEALARRERRHKSQVIALEDPLVNTLLELWELRAPGVEMESYTPAQLVDAMRRQGEEYSPVKLGRAISEKRSLFLNRGLDIQPGRDRSKRYWEFRGTPIEDPE